MSDPASDRTGTELVPAEAIEPPTRELGAAARPIDDGLPGLEPERMVSDWGRSERLSRLADATVTEFLYHYWLRVETEGVENVPGSGGALLVANRAGRLPLEGAMIARALRERPSRPRSLHLGYERTFSDLPGIGMVLTKLGAIRPHPANLHRLLFDEGQLVLVFPEGAAGPRKPISARYRLREFGHVELIEAAIRAGAPIVPVAVVGGEEATPTLGSLGGLTRLGLPIGVRLPIGLTLPLPAKFRLRFLQAVRTDDLAPAAWRDRGLVQELAEELRVLLQENLYQLVAERRSVWLG
jgi:1-acyl-sn-glycerol-3-phosphate acyltransferase